MATARFRHRGQRETAAGAQLLADAAGELVRAQRESVFTLAEIADGQRFDAADALDALQVYADGQREIRRAETLIFASLVLLGCTRHAIAQAVGCRVSTVTARIESLREAADIASAKRADLVRENGFWIVRKAPPAAPSPSRPRRRVPEAAL